MNPSINPRFPLSLKMRRFVGVALVCAFLNACTTTTTQRVAPIDSVKITSLVRVGDNVACTLRDGSRAAFKVTAVDMTALRGNSQSVAVSEIAQLELVRFSGGKTALLVAIVLAGVVVAVVAHSPGAFLGGPVIGL